MGQAGFKQVMGSFPGREKTHITGQSEKRVIKAVRLHQKSSEREK
jgi:hypothetical protein